MGSRHDTGREEQGRRRRGVQTMVAATLLAVTALTSTATAPAQTRAPEVGPPEASARWLQVDAGFLHTCGITTAHRLYCWGFDGNGLLGQGGTGPRNRRVPVEVAGHTADWAQVSAGYDQTCAVKTDHRLFCWGQDTLGDLGNGPGQGDSRVPVEVAGHTADWAEVAAGGNTCAVKTSGRLYCWGRDDLGGVGDGGTRGDAQSPVEVVGSRTDWQSVSAGRGHLCALTTDHRIRCWGFDFFGQVGDNEARSNRTSPTPVAGDAANWASVSVGDDHTCASKQSGRLFCWGHDHLGQLAAPGQDVFDRGTPTEVQRNRTDWAGVASGAGHTCATRTSGRLYCWGGTWRAAIGRDIAFDIQFTPRQVPGDFTDWAAVTAGLAHTCARRTNGVLYCFGNNEFGQTGTGSTARKVVGPVRVALGA